jgi:hypothetical protein
MPGFIPMSRKRWNARSLPKKIKLMETLKTVIIVTGFDMNSRFDEMVVETVAYLRDVRFTGRCW